MRASITDSAEVPRPERCVSSAASWVSKWALFSAYELLDEIDYKNIAYVAKHLGVTEEGMLFFNVHQDGDHYGKTSSQLLTLYDSEPETVEEAFRFISAHQLTMWQNMSEILASL